MYWFIYIIASILLSHTIARNFARNYPSFFLVILVILLTPAQIDLSQNHFAPALYSFLFNVLFERSFSLRILRPLILTLPISVVSLVLGYQIKRIFFSRKDSRD